MKAYKGVMNKRQNIMLIENHTSFRPRPKQVQMYEEPI
jgi:hypothetical protein